MAHASCKDCKHYDISHPLTCKLVSVSCVNSDKKPDFSPKDIEEDFDFDYLEE